jgi:catechol 2,3-dioxygenase-like lactoylglutathione lyase family enzyme
VSGLAEIALFTDDVPRVSAFYSSLVRSAPVAEWPDGVLFDVGGVKILVHARGAGVTDGPPNEDHFALSVADLEDSCDALRAGGCELLLEPRDYSWGRSAYLRDPDGRLVELAQS